MYDKILDLNVLYKSFEKCKSGVSWKSSVQRYEANLLSNIYNLRTELLNGTYRQKPFVEFDINERGKHRHIKSLHISDRVLQRALADEIMMPAVSPHLIYDNGASVKGKGVDFSRERLKTHLQKYYRRYGNKGYVLIIDYSKFFDSIPHNQLLKQFERLIPDDRLNHLIQDIISAFGGDTGLGIGSQISQVAGIYYPTVIDTYIKVVKGCKYYGRYMDDLYIIHDNKQYLKDLLTEVKTLSESMGLKINEKKTQIYRIDKGFTYLKLVHIVTDSGKVIRKPCKDNLTRERRKICKLRGKLDNGDITYAEIINNYKSWRGNIIKYDCYRSIYNIDKLFLSTYESEVTDADRDYFKRNRH